MNNYIEAIINEKFQQLAQELHNTKAALSLLAFHVAGNKKKVHVPATVFKEATRSLAHVTFSQAKNGAVTFEIHLKEPESE